MTIDRNKNEKFDQALTDADLDSVAGGAVPGSCFKHSCFGAQAEV